MNIPLLYEVLGRRIEGMRFLSGNLNASSITRLAMIEEAWGLFKQRPVIGYGFDNFRVISVFETYSHNNYVEVLTALGSVGFFIYYFFPFKLLISSIKLRKKGSTKHNVIIVFMSLILFMDTALVSYSHLITHVIIASCSSYYFYLQRLEKVSSLQPDR